MMVAADVLFLFNFICHVNNVSVITGIMNMLFCVLYLQSVRRDVILDSLCSSIDNWWIIVYATT